MRVQTNQGSQQWVLEYGVLENHCKPLVAAFKISDGPTFLTIGFQYPGLEKEVNSTAGTWARKATQGAKFPSQTDLREHQECARKCEAYSYTVNPPYNDMGYITILSILRYNPLIKPLLV